MKSSYLLVMFSLFSKAKPVRRTFDAPLAPDKPLSVVGDLHGCYGLLARLLQDPPEGRHMVFVGDYIDRGEDSAEVLRLLMRLQKAGSDCVTCLMGNHERMLLDFLDAPERSAKRWLNSGGLQTLASFRVPPPQSTAGTEDWLRTRDYLVDAIGPELEDWIRSLPLTFQSGNITVVHAAADPNRAIDDQSSEDLLWGNQDFFRLPRVDGNWIVHGHTIVSEPLVEKGRIAIDTGAYATGKLTCALIDTNDVRFRQA
jgi:serine/threonine protein phosphatase 1